MSAPLVPSPLDYVGLRKFAFYPPIAHPDPNEWRVGVGSHSEVQVVNAQTGSQIWVPRQYIGAVSETEDYLVVVGLTTALDFRKGAIEPRVKRVIQMPAGDLQKPESRFDRIRQPARPAPVVGIRLESKSDSTLNKLMIATCIAAILVAILAASLAAR